MASALGSGTKQADKNFVIEFLKVLSKLINAAVVNIMEFFKSSTTVRCSLWLKPAPMEFKSSVSGLIRLVVNPRCPWIWSRSKTAPAAQN